MGRSDVDRHGTVGGYAVTVRGFDWTQTTFRDFLDLSTVEAVVGSHTPREAPTQRRRESHVCHVRSHGKASRSMKEPSGGA